MLDNHENAHTSPNRRIYLSGHIGLVGGAILRTLRARGYSHVPVRRHGELDLTDQAQTRAFFSDARPELVYNLAAQSHVQVSFETPEYTANADALGTLRLLEAVRILGMQESCRFYQASTSELFGNASEVPQRETTPFAPRSPYAAATLIRQIFSFPAKSSQVSLSVGRYQPK